MTADVTGGLEGEGLEVAEAHYSRASEDGC